MAKNPNLHTLPDSQFAGVRFLSVSQFLRWAGISRFLFYKLVREGWITPRKIASRTVIPWDECVRFARELPPMKASSGRHAGQGEA